MNRGFWLILVLVVGVLYLPFLGQAFHIDDRIYLEVAENILVKPLFPYDYPAVFEGISAPDAASHSHLPLTSYYLAFWRILAGDHVEWLDHLVFLVFPLLAAWGIFDLARRRVKDPRLTALLLLASPAVVVLGHTLMPDVPLLAFWTIAMSRALRILEGSTRSLDWLVLSLSALAAAFISLVTAGLLLLIAASLVLYRSRPAAGSSRMRWAVVLTAPILLWGIWYLAAYLHYDRFVLLSTVQHMNKRETFDWALFGVKGLSFLLNLGAVFLCPVALWFGFTGRIRTWVGLLVFALALVPFFTFVPDWQWKYRILFAVFLSSGVLAFWEVVLLALSKDNFSRILALWFFGILAAAFLLYYSGSVRYVMLCVPPVILAWQMRLEKNPFAPARQNLLLWGGLVLTGLYALLPAVADNRMAECYRSAARELVARYQAPGKTIWFTGEWGYRYYFSREGAKMIRRVDTRAKPGDIIIKPYLASPWVTLYDGSPGSSLLEQRAANLGFPVRILDYSSHAGFYSTGWGILPFSLDSGKYSEWFNIYRVEKAYEGPVPEEEHHW